MKKFSKKLPIIFTITIIVVLGFSITASAANSSVPDWVRNVATWWEAGEVSDDEFKNTITYLIEQNIISVESSHEIIIKIENQFEKTKLRLNDITTSTFNGGSTIGLSGNLQTESGEFIPNAEILIVGDGPCPSDGIIAKGLTDKHGRYRIYIEMMIWDPSDNLIKIHAEYLGDEIYSPSSSQDEVIVVYPTTDTKSCLTT